MDNKTAIKESRQDPILDFLALFNQVDKHLDKILWTDKFLPYNEKLKRIMQWDYSISWFIKLHQYQLRYFGEIRNQITHWIKLDGHTYVIPSEYAIKQLAIHATNIKKPPKILDIFRKDVFKCTLEDNLKYIVDKIQNERFTQIPVYNGWWNFVWVISEENIFTRLANNFNNPKNLENFKVSQLPINQKNQGYIFVDKMENVYRIDKYFTEKKDNNEQLWAVFITETGNPNEEVLWVITSWDTALVDKYVVH